MLTQPLVMTMDQVMILADRTANTDKDDGREMAKPLLLKLGAVYLELVGDAVTTATATIHITEPEAWLLRSKTNSGDRCDRDSKLGIHTLRQLYAILLAFDAADATGPVLDAEDSCHDRRWSDEEKAKYVSDDDADLTGGDLLAGAA